jgi:dihydroneopterin aldolase
METISLQNMAFYAYHGCFAEEQITGTHFEVDVQVDADLQAAALSDDLNDTLNYQWIYDVVRREMQQPSKLLEHVAGRVLRALFDGAARPLARASVTIRKCNPPLGGKVGYASVTMHRTPAAPASLQPPKHPYHA